MTSFASGSAKAFATSSELSAAGFATVVLGTTSVEHAHESPVAGNKTPVLGFVADF
jgi:hypothetical protein